MIKYYFFTSWLLLMFFICPTYIMATNNDMPDLLRASQSFQNVAQQCKSAVVSISTVRTVQSQFRSPFMNDPFFDYFYAQPHGSQQREGLGSGVIVSTYGHILTNHHVVENADEITVTLSDGQEFKAVVIGSDKKTDLAVLKIDGNDNFSLIPLGNSEELKIGEWAIAIGNPFGLAGTVTVGIISATGRSGVIDADSYADFIQTDAAINPGNSGGALLNIHGQLIGINTAIFSQNGGYMGIGFAVPVNMAKRVMEDILTYGKVKRGMLGVTIQPITDQVYNDYNLSSREGAFVVSVQPNSTAQKAGIKPNDIIIELGGKKVSDFLSLRTRISELKLDEASYCIVLRENKKIKLSFTLNDDFSSTQPSSDRLGLTVQDLNSAVRKDLGIPHYIQGIVITKVDPQSTAYTYKFKKGQVITRINNYSIRSVRDYQQLLAANQYLRLTVYEKGYEYTIVIR